MEVVVGLIVAVVAFFVGSWGGRQAPLRALAGQVEEVLVAAQFAQDGDIEEAGPLVSQRLAEIFKHCVSAGVKPEEVFSAVISRGRFNQSQLTELADWLDRN